MKRLLLPLLFTAMTTTALAKAGIYEAAPVDSTADDSTAYWKQMNLGEVAVTAQKQLVTNKIDRLTYDVQSDNAPKSSSVLEILRKVPMVTVDGQDNIKIKGQTSFKIYRNGHPDPSFSSSNVSDVLKSIPASTIKSIEVITDPGAKEDAEGTTYILNIVTKTNSNMKGVMANASYSMNDKGSLRQDDYITVQSGKLIVSANGAYTHATKPHTHNKEDIQTYFKDSGYTMSQHTESETPANVLYGNLNASYDVDSLNLISLSAYGLNYNLDVNQWGNWEMNDGNGNQIYKYDTKTWLPSYNYYEYGGRMDFQHKTHLDGEVFTASYMLSTTHKKQNEETSLLNAINPPVNYTGYISKNKESFIEHIFQLDYVRPFAKYHKMEFGLRYTNRNNHSIAEEQYTEAEELNTNTNFEHTTQIAAAYGEWMMHKGKWSVRAGLRYEYSYLKANYKEDSGKDFHRNLNDWCPSASLQYQISDANSLKISYATSINRPGIGYLNPARRESPEDIEYGNPLLTSARNNKLDINFMHYGKKFTFTITPEYYWSNDKITDIIFSENNRTVSTYSNALHYKSLNMNASVQAQLLKGNNIGFNAYVGHDSYKNPNLGLSYTPWNAYFSLNATQMIPWKIMLGIGGSVDCGHFPSSVYGYDTNWHDYYISFQRSFLKEDRLTVRVIFINFADPKYFKRHAANIQGDYLTSEYYSSRPEKFGFRVSLKLGKLKASVKQVETAIKNDDVVGGISKN